MGVSDWQVTTWVSVTEGWAQNRGDTCWLGRSLGPGSCGLDLLNEAEWAVLEH